MNRNELKTLSGLLENLRNERGVDDFDLEAIKRLQSFVVYKQRVEDCKNMLSYMERELEAIDESEEQRQEFYKLNFTIGFGDCREVVIPNNADIFDAISSILKDEIEEYDRY